MTKYRIVRKYTDEDDVRPWYVLERWHEGTFFKEWREVYKHTSFKRCESHLNTLRTKEPPMVMKEYQF